jgi:hypothetical protein
MPGVLEAIDRYIENLTRLVRIPSVSTKAEAMDAAGRVSASCKAHGTWRVC